MHLILVCVAQLKQKPSRVVADGVDDGSSDEACDSTETKKSKQQAQSQEIHPQTGC